MLREDGQNVWVEPLPGPLPGQARWTPGGEGVTSEMMLWACEMLSSVL